MARTPKNAMAAVADNTLRITQQPGEPEGAAVARAIAMPTVRAGVTVRDYSRSLGGTDLMSMVEELGSQVEAVQSGNLKRAEAMLVAQAHSLDAIFNALAQRAALNMGEHLGAVERYMRLALKAQSQCRATLETLATIKNPPPLAFVRQANIGQAVQVNNGPAPMRARETESGRNELLDRIESASDSCGERCRLGACVCGDGWLKGKDGSAVDGR